MSGLIGTNEMILEAPVNASLALLLEACAHPFSILTALLQLDSQSMQLMYILIHFSGMGDAFTHEG